MDLKAMLERAKASPNDDMAVAFLAVHAAWVASAKQGDVSVPDDACEHVKLVLETAKLVGVDVDGGCGGYYGVEYWCHKCRTSFE